MMTPGRDRKKVNDTHRRRSLGKSGESIARGYLETNGYRIFQTNYRQKYGEIDIIALRGRLIVFCEVKTRIGTGESIESYSEKQQYRMVRTSEEFLNENALILPKVFDLRYDLILVGVGKDGNLEVKDHIEDAFRP